MIPARFQQVLDAASPVGDALRAGGHRAYVVGGLVRDLLDGREDDRRDIDLTTDARPADIKAAVEPIAEAVWTQGERFGTIGCLVGGVPFEVTTHRAERYEPGSRKPEVSFADAIDADLSRRDFTVNAMAVELTGDGGGQLIDPFGGVEDLHARRLRTPLGPEQSFSDDPLRMLRAARFIAGHELVPDDDLVAAVEAMAERLSIVSAERIRDEFDKLMVVPEPRPGLWFLVDTGLMDEFFPEIAAMRVEQDPIHRHKDVLTHTFAVVSNVGHLDAEGNPNRLTRLAALYHDIGKPKTRAIGPNGVSFHHHEVVGARMTRDRMRALKYSNADVEAVTQLVYLHLRFHTYSMGWTDAAVRRFVRDAGPLLPQLIELTRCDCTTRNKRKAAELARRMDELEERIAALREQEELDAIRPDLDGQAVMELLDIPPGPVVGEALRYLLELRTEEGPLERDEAERRLREWWEARG
ncbi:MAG: CCA tRNA nucleotidyltransferase [Acidimicrobiia bacterium]|nr:CCA tRNA nucleotidyltransferase [Acidimicrobiia bacterium]